MLTRMFRSLNQEQLLPTVTSGIVIGMLEVVISISLAALIFSGELVSFVGNGVGLALFSAISGGIMVSLFSSLSGTVGGNQDVPAAIMAVMVTAIIAAMPSGTDSHTLFVTAAAAISLATLLTGLFLFLLGYFRLGGLVRFLPYPVVGGFLAGSGWLLFIGGIGVMADISVTTSNLPLLFQPQILLRWAPGLVFALVLFSVISRTDHYLATPTLILGSVGLFYLILFLNGRTPSEISEQGWLLGPFAIQSLWQPLTFSDLRLVQWPLIARQGVHIATIIIISAIALLLNASGLEVATAKDISLNRELRTAGIANIISSLGNGLIGFQQLSLSSLNLKLGTVNRWSGLFSALTSLLALIAGASLLSFFPKIIPGGLLVFLGLSFLYEWIYETWTKFPKSDYAVIILILIVIATVGFLEGVAVGLVTTIILFVLNYSRISVVRHALTGQNYQSRVNYNPMQRRYLFEQGKQIYILRLQGFIFFGTADNLLNQLRARLEDNKQPLPRFILLDFRRVTGLDATALLSFNKIQQLVQTDKINLIFTELSPTMKRQLIQGGLTFEPNSLCAIFSDLDQGVEWCETRLLADSGMSKDDARPFADILVAHAGGDRRILGLLNFLEKQEIARGHYLMRQGDKPDNLYFIESGQITAQLAEPGKEPIRLETMGSGHIVGEIGFYLGGERSASVVADKPSTVYRFSQSEFARMQHEDPETAAAFHKLIVRLLSNRVTHLVTIVNALQR